MTMETRIKFKVLFYNGRNGTIYHNFEHPEFQEIINTFLVCGEKRENVITHNDQLDQAVEDWDKKDWMDKNEIQMIYNWEISHLTILQ